MGVRTAPHDPPPDQRSQFHLYQVDGLEIYLHKGLALMSSQVRIDLGGFWRFKWLKVGGLAPMAACTI